MAERFVKICGLRDLASARVAADAGASALGFILAESKRRVTPQAVRAIADELWASRPPIVGVTVNATSDEIARFVAEAGLDVVQLSGDESPDIVMDIAVPVIKALRFAADVSVDEALSEVERWLDGPHPAAHVIVEGHRAGAYGGTGTRADWTLVREIAARYPIILAGGLTPENVAEANAVVDPFGVDVSSGVERFGAKDHGMIRGFVENARQTAGGDDRG